MNISLCVYMVRCRLVIMTAASTPTTDHDDCDDDGSVCSRIDRFRFFLVLRDSLCV